MASDLLNGPGRLTREEILRMIRIVIADSNHPFANDMKEFLDLEIDKVHNKKKYDYRRNRHIKNISDQELKEIVESALTDEWQSVNDILGEIGIDELTSQKFASIIELLINEQVAEKTTTRRTKDMPKEFHRKTVYRLKNNLRSST